MIAKFINESVIVRDDPKGFKQVIMDLKLDQDIKVWKLGIAYHTGMTDGENSSWAVIPLPDGSTVLAYSCQKVDMATDGRMNTFANMVELIKSHPGKDDHCKSFTKLFGQYVHPQYYKHPKREEDMERSKKFSALARNAVKSVSKMTSFSAMVDFIQKAGQKADILYKRK